MKIYNLCDLFMLGGRTQESYPLIVIGYTSSSKDETYAAILDYINSLIIPDYCTLSGVDIILAEKFQQLLPEAELIGCTMQVPGFSDSTGGVLGNPHLPIRSACGEIEDSPDGWKILSFPGGPGLAIKAEKAVDLEVLKDAAKAPLKGKKHLEHIAKQAYQAGVDSLLAITDGTGEKAKGSALIQHKRDYMLWSLDEV